jgi:hypothetical protein
MPKTLEPNTLYVSDEFETAAHLCACGCRAKVRTPLGPTEWRYEDTAEGPSLWPSVGNWQQPCQSHYVIRRGEIIWAGKWSPSQVEAGRRAEQARRETYFEERARGRTLPVIIWRWLKRMFGG